MPFCVLRKKKKIPRYLIRFKIKRNKRTIVDFREIGRKNDRRINIKDCQFHECYFVKIYDYSESINKKADSYKNLTNR